MGMKLALADQLNVQLELNKGNTHCGRWQMNVCLLDVARYPRKRLHILLLSIHQYLPADLACCFTTSDDVHEGCLACTSK